MLKDRYGNPLTTTSQRARDAYVDGLDRLIGGYAGTVPALNRAIEADDGFAMAYLALARINQVVGNRAALLEALDNLERCTSGVTAQESSAIDALSTFLRFKPAYPQIRAHVAEYPRDVLLAQTCTNVFGMIGFSGVNGREAETLAYTSGLAPHYGDDWWFLCMHAFAQLEVGQLDASRTNIDRAIELMPDAPHVIHVKTHHFYETGESEGGLNYMNEVFPGIDKTAMMHCHVAWHAALWALQSGDVNRMWEVIDTDLSPSDPSSPPLNVLTDLAAILARAELHGIDVPKQRWIEVSNYAKEKFPNTGLAFADVHAAVAHANAGEGDALQKIITDAKGPAAEIVSGMAEGFKAYAKGDWATSVKFFSSTIGQDERIGGSRAQRDLIEFTMANALLRLGKSDEANRILQIQRPISKTRGAVVGL